ncbi:hypothetical protein HDV57DRAFT_45686 [Trichoderma longibrachiatum]
MFVHADALGLGRQSGLEWTGQDSPHQTTPDQAQTKDSHTEESAPARLARRASPPSSCPTWKRARAIHHRCECLEAALCSRYPPPPPPTRLMQAPNSICRKDIVLLLSSLPLPLPLPLLVPVLVLLRATSALYILHTSIVRLGPKKQQAGPESVRVLGCRRAPERLFAIGAARVRLLAGLDKHLGASRPCPPGPAGARQQKLCPALIRFPL